MFDLASHLKKSIREVETFDSAEISEWMAYQRLVGPLGPEREDLRAAIIASTIANFAPYNKKYYKVSDFMPYHKEHKNDDDQILMKKRMEAWAKSLNPKRERKK